MFPGVTVPQAEVGKAAIVGEAAAAGGLFGGASGLLGPVGMGLSVAEGLGMFNGGGTDMSSAISGGTFYTGEMSTRQSSALIIVAVVVLGLILIFRGKK